MITKAESAGFCGGVKIAVEKATSMPIGKRCVIGSLVHNASVIERIKGRGIEFVKKPDSFFDEVVISAHGISKSLEKSLDGYKIIDATCVNVRKIIDIAKELGESDCLIMVGDAEHTEVKNVTSYAKNFVILKKHIIEKEKINEILTKPFVSYVVVFQTTTSKKDFIEYSDYFKTLGDSRLKLVNTLCPSVQKRIDESVKIAKENDLMIVVGDRTSANSMLLFNECKKVNPNTLFVSSVSELPFSYPENIGVTAGASTDPKDIDLIVKNIEILTKTKNNL